MLIVVLRYVIMLNVVAPYFRACAIKLFIDANNSIGATTFIITTLSVMTLSIKTISIMTLSIMTLSITTLCIKTLSIMTLSRTLSRTFK
jgi:hypothetical protein